jgi:glycosyltransferase involved in cell wall biosynthesis
MKILIVTHGFPPTDLGGTELYSYNLAKSLTDIGIEASIFTRMTTPIIGKDIYNEGYSFEKYEGLRVFRAINSSNSLREFLNPYIANTFKKIIKKENPDLIHFQHLVFLSATLPEIVLSYKIPSIITLHDYWFFCPRVQLLNKENEICEGPMDGVNCAFCFDIPFFKTSRLENRLKKFIPSRLKVLVKRIRQEGNVKKKTYISEIMEFHFRLNFLRKQFDLFNYRISPSQYLIKRYEKVGFHDISYLPHGFSLVPKIDVKLSDTLRIGYMGNINYPKGLSVVIDELYSLLLKGNVKLIIYGKPYDLQYFNKIKKKIKKLNPNSIEFCGGYKNTFEELWKIFSTFDILVFPSIWEENAPIVVREALLASKPVIASNLGGVPEIVADEVNGLLFNPYKAGDLQDKIRSLLNDPGLLTRFINGAQNTQVDSLEEHAEKLRYLYEDLLKKRGRLRINQGQ